MKEDKSKQLWNNYFSAQTSSDEKQKELARNDLVVFYNYLVEREATKMARKIKEVQLEEFASWGIDGLFDAINGFEISKGFRFSTYATPRIKGAMLDNIRKIDWVPRLVRQRSSKIEKAKQSLESILGRKPTNVEVAKNMKIPLKEYEEIMEKSVPVACVSMYAGQNDQNDENFEITSIQSEEKEPVDKVLREEFFEKLLGKGFTRIERKIIFMHHHQDLTMKEIAEEMKYSESRISQMHAQIIERLKSKIARNPVYMEGIETVIGN